MVEKEKKLRLTRQIELYRGRAYWGPWKARAAIFAAFALFCGGLAVNHWLRNPAPQTITVHIVRE
jgi:hypothetical protein